MDYVGLVYTPSMHVYVYVSDVWVSEWVIGFAYAYNAYIIA